MSTVQGPLTHVEQGGVTGAGRYLSSATATLVRYDLTNLLPPLAKVGLTAVRIQLELNGVAWPASLVVVLEGRAGGSTYETIATYTAAPGLDDVRDVTGMTSIQLRVSTTNGAVDIYPFITGIQGEWIRPTGANATLAFYTADTSAGSPETLNTVTIVDGVVVSWTQV